MTMIDTIIEVLVALRYFKLGLKATGRNLNNIWPHWSNSFKKNELSIEMKPKSEQTSVTLKYVNENRKTLSKKPGTLKYM